MPENYEEIYLDRKFTDAELAEAIAKTYGLEPKKVFVSSSGNWVDEPFQGSDIVCDVRDQPGDFFTRVLFMMFNRELLHPTRTQIGHLCELANCRAIVEDDGSNYYIAVLITGKNQFQRVWLDSEQMREELAIVVYASYKDGDETNYE